jgi:hypothetical protein
MVRGAIGAANPAGPAKLDGASTSASAAPGKLSAIHATSKPAARNAATVDGDACVRKELHLFGGNDVLAGDMVRG